MATTTLLEDIENPEIVIGLVGPVGVDLRDVVGILREHLAELNYTSDHLHISDVLRDLPKYKSNPAKGLPDDLRIRELMNRGDSLRASAERGDALALLAVTPIRAARKARTGSETKPATRHAYILHSLKHDAEVATLRKIYGKMFFLVSVYAPRADRITALSARIALSHHDPTPNKFRGIAEELVELDSNAGDDDFGQNVQKAFPMGDMFVRSSNRSSMSKEIKRLMEAWFRYPFHTPTKDEHGMFHAKAASLRSADLSRQVGAVITASDGEILSVGCNEVPKFTGGAIWTGDDEDHRDFALGHDASAKMKREIVAEIVKRFQEAKLLNDTIQSKRVDDLTDDLLYGELESVLKDSRVTNIIEFGRIVHAEMAAIMDAARRGVPLRGSTLYCTTFPCHMCARHIIAAGIQRVVYIEPYPKSAALELYRKAISVDGEGDSNLLRFESFCGISPSKYIDIFTMKSKRKDKRGTIVAWKKKDSYPLIDQVYLSYLEAETAVLHYVRENQEVFGIVEKTPTHSQAATEAPAVANSKDEAVAPRKA